MTTKPALGVIFYPTFPPEILVEYAQKAEAAGFDDLWFWEDCFFAGGFTSAATALAATRQLNVGVGLFPATVRNPLFTAMEITTLARLYPGRFWPGFGHGVAAWMKQIGAYPKSSLTALEETVTAVRALLAGEEVTLLGQHVHLDRVQLKTVPHQAPPLLIGGIREKSLHLAGRIGDGAIMTGMSSPAYLRWANGHIAAGQASGRRDQNTRIVFALAKISPDGKAARMVARRFLARQFAEHDPHLFALSIAEEAPALVERYGVEEAARRMPDEWVDALAIAGNPHQAAEALERLADAGADRIILEPIQGDPDALDEYIQYIRLVRNT